MLQKDQQKMNISMCGCGFLGVYHLGVATSLVEHGQSLMEKVDNFAGASAGSLMSAVLLLAPEKLEECIKHTYDLASEIRSRPLGALTPGYCLLNPVREFLEDVLPQDADKLATGRLHISLTNTHRKKRVNVIVNKYSSREELIQCLIASCFIPVYAGTKYPVVKGEKHIDGGYTNNMPIFPDGRTVRISPFCGSQDICPIDMSNRGWYFTASNQDFRWNRHNLVRGIHALFPPSQAKLEKYFNKGKRDCVRFLKNEGMYSQ